GTRPVRRAVAGRWSGRSGLVRVGDPTTGTRPLRPLTFLLAAPMLVLALVLALLGAPARVEAQGRTPVQSAAPLVASGPQRTERIEAELVPMSAWATPGSTAIVAV